MAANIVFITPNTPPMAMTMATNMIAAENWRLVSDSFEK